MKRSTSELNNSTFSLLFDDVIVIIISHCGEKEFLLLRGVDKRFMKLLDKPSLWLDMMKRHGYENHHLWKFNKETLTENPTTEITRKIHKHMKLTWIRHSGSPYWAELEGLLHEVERFASRNKIKRMTLKSLIEALPKFSEQLSKFGYADLVDFDNYRSRGLFF